MDWLDLNALYVMRKEKDLGITADGPPDSLQFRMGGVGSANLRSLSAFLSHNASCVPLALNF